MKADPEFAHCCNQAPTITKEKCPCTYCSRFLDVATCPECKARKQAFSESRLKEIWNERLRK